MTDEGERPIEDYSQGDLQDYIWDIYNRHSVSGDKLIRRILRKKWKELVTVYNRRAGSQVYKASI